MMRCHICLPDSRILEIEIDPKGTGQSCLDKVCERLSVLEDDYLGLRYSGPKQELLWLNLRNRVDQQMSGPQPYRFQLRIKFYVQPHTIQQDATRHLFYQQILQDLQLGQLDIQGRERLIPKLVSLIAQVEYGDQTSNSYQLTVYETILHSLNQQANRIFLDAIWQEHGAQRGVPRHSAEYRMLQEVASLPTFGTEFHAVRSAHGEQILFGVGPEGILLKNMSTNVQENLPYPSIHMATHRDREVYLQKIDDSGELQPAVGYRLVSRKAAVALYRCITEMHSFYRCDTVSCDVSNQFCRDLKGTLVSIFNENSELGKSYIFDIKRTSREAYDYARRKLYSLSQSTQTLNAGNGHGSLQSIYCDGDSVNLDSDRCHAAECQRAQERLSVLEDALLCCICLSRLVSAVLCPCGHMTCSDCSLKIEECPLCRTEIERRQKVFLPMFGTQKEKFVPEEEHETEADCGEFV